MFKKTDGGLLTPEGVSAMCVQRFDDSLNSAIHTTYRISLRSSSYGEPRDPSLKDIVLFKTLLNAKINIGCSSKVV